MALIFFPAVDLLVPSSRDEYAYGVLLPKSSAIPLSNVFLVTPPKLSPLSTYALISTLPRVLFVVTLRGC